MIQTIAKCVLYCAGITIEVDGLCHVKKLNGYPTVLYAYHESIMDSALLYIVIPRPYKTFGETDDDVHNRKLRLAGYLLRMFDMLFLRENDNIIQTAAEFKKATEYIRQGNCVSFFPATFLGSNGNTDNFREIPLLDKAAIIPVTIFGSKKVLDKTEAGLKMQKGKIVISFSPPLFMEKLTMPDHIMTMDKIKKIISSRYEAMRNGS